MAKNRAAQAAAMIRREIKTAFPKMAFTCTSKSYAGGNSISIDLMGAPDERRELVERMAAKYRLGNFDGMTDCYEYSNRNPEIPQANYIFINNYRREAA